MPDDQRITPDPVVIPTRVPPVNLVITMRHFAKLDGVLRVDVAQAFHEADTAQHAFLQAEGAAKERLLEVTRRARRNATRALFAWIEAIVWNMKQTALSLDALLPKTTFTPAEAAILREMEYSLSKDGEAEERTRYPRAVPNLKFAFAIFGRPVESGFTLKVGGVEWDAYLGALEIRDRLTHPKEAGDIKVSDDEHNKALVVTREWFDRNFRGAFNSLVTALEKREGARIEIERD